MILAPDFLDDWRMDVLATALGRDPLAPLYVIRLWSWCQNRKSWQFPDLTAMALRGICKAQHEPELLIEAMVSAGYVERMGDGFSSSAWAALNAQLIAAWTNGKNGGRPPKKPDGNPTKTQRLTDKKREEKKTPPSAPIGATSPPLAPKPVEPVKPAEATTPAPPPSPPPPAPPAPPAAPPRGRSLFGDDDDPPAPKKRAKAPATPAEVERPEWFDAVVWGEFLAYRLEYEKKNKKVPFTAASIKGSIGYFRKCLDQGEKPEAAFLRMSAHGWRVPYPERQFNPFGSSVRTTTNDRNAAAGAALAGFSRAQPERTPRHAAHSADAEDIEYRDTPRTPE